MNPETRQESGGERRSAMNRGDLLWLGAILALAIVVRLVYLQQIREHPLFTTLMGDPAVYFAQARDILGGKLVPDHAYFHSSPLYPFFLALVEKLGGSSLHAVRAVQSAVGVVSVALVFLLGRLTVGKRSGLVAAFLTALYVPFIFFEGEILEITLVLAFVLGSLVLLRSHEIRPGAWKVAAAGVLLGLAGLGKPNLLLFAPVGAVWLAVRARAGSARGERRGRAARTRARPDRAQVATALIFFVAAGVVVLPATVHNFRAEGDLIPVSSNGGINLYIGNHTGSPGVFQVPPEMRFDLRVSSAEVAEREAGRSMSAGEVSDFWTRKTLAEIGAAPGRWVALMWRKFVLFWNHYEIPNHYHLYFVREFAPVLRLPVGTFGVVAPLGLLGLGLALLKKKRVGLLVLFGLTFMASVVPFFITGRYRLAIAPVLLVGAGYAAVSLWDTLRARQWRSLVTCLIIVALLALAVGVNTIEFSFAAMHNAVGSVLGRRGDMEGAATEFASALALNSGDISSRYNFGLALYELGRFDEAATQFERAVGAHPRYYEAWLGLARSHASAGRIAEAHEALVTLLGMEPPAPEPVRAEAAGMLTTLTTSIEGTQQGTDK
jgi:4-amino-4-deoxy-L-arabinose transferase-like glycosyltransferase